MPPTDLKCQRATKNGRSAGDATEGTEIERDVKNLDLNVEAGMSLDMGCPGHGVVNVGGRESYASMAAKTGSCDSGYDKVVDYTDEEVIVMDEDCVVDESETISIIKFSERVHEQIDKRPQVGSTTASSKLFGPWMMVYNQRRCNNQSSFKVAEMDKVKDNVNGSRFVALDNLADENVETSVGEKVLEIKGSPPAGDQVRIGDIDSKSKGRLDNRGYKINDVYLESNPQRRSKGGKASSSSAKSVKVVSLIDGEQPHASIRMVEAKTGSHTVMRVIDSSNAHRHVVNPADSTPLLESHFKLSKGLWLKKGSGSRSVANITTEE
ncbi:hypothetical protein V6N12_031275 [Hibiscus sabdariffa]|uniref:Uncharacterized protein n=1 Tax=Hibiscus sabdariffa TaxID=183260 RepID=A0ABR2EC39_9ROSI